jgi:hypothetical protein
VFQGSPQVRQFRTFLAFHYGGLARAERGLGHAAASAAARQRLVLWPGAPHHLYMAACELAQCAALATDADERGRYADEAMTALRAAVARDGEERRSVLTDSDLEPLRARPDFQALGADIGFPADPFAAG